MWLSGEKGQEWRTVWILFFSLSIRNRSDSSQEGKKKASGINVRCLFSRIHLRLRE